MFSTKNHSDKKNSDACSFWSFSQLNEQLNEFHKTYSSFEGKDIYLVVGSTGIGKSTFVNYITGSEMEEINDHESCTTRIQPKEGFNEFTKIGYGADSETLVPQAIPSGKTSYYADCPAFNSTVIDHTVSGSILTQHAIQQSKTVLGIIAFISYPTYNDHLVECIAPLMKYLPDFTQHKCSILFIASKTPPGLTPKNIYTRFQQFLESKNDRSRKSAADFLKTFSDDYTNIHIFNPLDEKDRAILLSKIERLKPISKKEFSFPLFDSEHIEIQACVLKAATHFIELTNIVKSLNQFFYNAYSPTQFEKNFLILAQSHEIQCIVNVAKLANFDSPIIKQFLELYEQYGSTMEESCHASKKQCLSF